MADPELIYGADQIALELGLNIRTVRRLINKEEIPSFRLGRIMCAHRPTLKQWLAKAPQSSKAA